MVDVVFTGSDGAPERDVSLVLCADALVADVIGSLSGPVPEAGGLVVDGRRYGGETRVSDVRLVRGSVVRCGVGRPSETIETAIGGSPDSALLPAAVEVRIIGGLDAGQRFLLPAGHFLIGRSGAEGVDIPLGSDTVSARHAALTVDAAGACRLQDLGSRNGLRVEHRFVSTDTDLPAGALVQIGACQLVVTAVADYDTPVPAVASRAGLIAFDRMPRTVQQAEVAALQPPVAPPDSGPPGRLSWATVLVPLVIAAVLVVLMPRNSMLVVFMALSPVLAVATWAEERRRGRGRTRKAQTQYRRALELFAGDVQAARDAELLRHRRASPDLAETVRRALAPSSLLWQRRPAHDDFCAVRIGTADLPWRPVLSDRADQAPETAALLAAAGVLRFAPVDCSWAAGRYIGVVGPRAAALSVARALVLQAAIHQGPADLLLAVLTEPARIADWDWTKWLPHTRTNPGPRLLAGSPAERHALAAALRAEGAGAGPSCLHVVVMDAEGITAGRSCPPRELLTGAAGPLAAIVLADRLDQLPGACTDIIEVLHPDGVGRYTQTSSGSVVTEVQLAGASAFTARTAVLALARFEDAELVEPGARLPGAAPLVDLFAPAQLTAAGIEARWTRRRTGDLAAVIGAGVDGPLVLDLVRDGPHGLIAGTTGAGKSELLRTIVASLAASHSPRDVTFVLIDYKGGSAFAECARLPHTVGFVTDLDERLGSRALTCLEAELRHRERMLREANAVDVRDYIAGGELSGPLPRLVVAIDEFATLAAELPDFIDALVGIAQRGRSLGVHLLLATQRPRGAVKDNIRANSNLRIALRTHDATDSADVLDSADAANISRAQPGRAFLRLGPGELVPFQSAYVSGASMSSTTHTAAVQVGPFEFGPGGAPGLPPAPSAGELAGDTDLATIVDAAVSAASNMGIPAPRQPWPEPLGSLLLAGEIASASASATAAAAGWSAQIGLADQPDQQRKVPYVWNSGAGGLLLYGVAGSGTSTTLAALAVSLARDYKATDLHLYVLDFGTQLLAPLAALPNVAAVVGPNDRDRQERLILRLRSEVTQRQLTLAAAGASGIEEYNARCSPSDRLPGIVLLLDNWSAFAAAFDDLPGLTVRDQLARVVADGAGLGIFTVIAADRANAVPASIGGLIAQKLVFRLSDPHDFGAFGIATRGLPDFVPGRAIDAATRREVQIALPHGDGVAAAVAVAVAAARREFADGDSSDDLPARRPQPVLTLPADINLSDVHDRARISSGEWWLPFGIGDRALEPVGLRLADAEHALIAGGARAGKSSLLLLLGRLAASGGSPRLLVIAASRSPVCELDGAQVFGADDEAAAVALARADDSPCLVLVDDAERVDDTSRSLRALLEERRPGDRFIAAGRSDALRSSYGHWTQELRRSRQGIVLKPNPDVDGDLWGMLLPRRGPCRFSAGRGYLVNDGEAELVQVARP